MYFFRWNEKYDVLTIIFKQDASFIGCAYAHKWIIVCYLGPSEYIENDSNVLYTDGPPCSKCKGTHRCSNDQYPNLCGK